MTRRSISHTGAAVRLASVVLLLLAARGAAAGVVVVTVPPTAIGGVADSDFNGTGDIPQSAPFIFSRDLSPNAGAAIEEFDLRSVRDRIVSAHLVGSIHVNNSLDTGDRVIALTAYRGNGTVDLADFQAAGPSIGSVTYRPNPPQVFSVAFDFDVIDEIKSLAPGGKGLVGVRYSAANSPQAPSVLDVNAPPVMVLTTVPLPPAALPGAVTLLGAVVSCVIYRRRLVA